MKIVLSTHFDIARPVMHIKLDGDGLNGLIDNFAGVFVSYEAQKKTGIPLFLTNYEELDYDGAEDVAKTLDKDTLVIVIDTTIDGEDKKAYIGNVYNLDTEEIKADFSDKILFKDGFYEEKEDETWIYGKKYGFKTFYFGVPIKGEYHSTENKISTEDIEETTKILIDLINWFKKKEA